MHIFEPDSLHRPRVLFKSAALVMVCLGLLLASAAQAAEPVGTVKFARGDVTIRSITGETRKAEEDAELMRNERVSTGTDGIAVILLNDDSRMVLRPNSEFRVSKFDMAEDDDDASTQSAVLNLLRGGLRLVTGLIGRVNPSGYRLSTPIATIGIRGTEFNSRLCSDDCGNEERTLSGSADAAIDEGLYVNVDDGRIFLRNFAADPVELGQGESGYVSDLDSLPVRLSAVPAFLALDKIPSPSGLDMDDIEMPEDLFAGVEAAAGVGVAVAAAVVGGSDDEDEAPEVAVRGVSGTYEIDDIDYSSNTPLSERKFLFGANPDIEFHLTQEGNKISGYFDGDREGKILKGTIDGNRIEIEFYLEALGGQFKDGTASWTVNEDGDLEGDFTIRGAKHRWILEKTD